MAKAASKGLTKSEIYAQIADEVGISKADVKKVFESIQAMLVKQLSKKGATKFVLPGMLRLTVKKIKAVKGGQKKEHPFRKGEFYVTKDRPASVKVRAFPVKSLAEAVKEASGVGK